MADNKKELAKGMKVLMQVFPKREPEVCTIIYVHVNGQGMDIMDSHGEKYGKPVKDIIQIIEE